MKAGGKSQPDPQRTNQGMIHPHNQIQVQRVIGMIHPHNQIQFQEKEANRRKKKELVTGASRQIQLATHTILNFKSVCGLKTTKASSTQLLEI